MMRQNLMKKICPHSANGRSMKALWTAFKSFGDNVFECANECPMEIIDLVDDDDNEERPYESDDESVTEEKETTEESDEESEESEEESEESEEESEESEEESEESEEESEEEEEESEEEDENPVMDTQEAMIMKMFESEEVIIDGDIFVV